MPDAQAPAPTFPYPPRFWWLKRLLVLGLVLVLAVAGVRLWWGRSSERALEEAHARLAQRGGPVVAEDLNPKADPPASQDAGRIYLKAFGMIRPNARGPSSSQMVYKPYPPYPPKWHKLADASFAANRPAFELARTARPFDTADWGIRYRSPMVTFPLLTQLNPARDFALQLSDAAMRDHVLGNDAAALEYLRDVRHLGKSVNSQQMLISHLVAIGIEMLAMDRLNVLAPELTVADGADVPLGRPAPDGPARRGQVEALIRELLDDPPPGVEAARAIDGEFIVVRDILRSATRPNWVMAPALDRVEIDMIERTTAFGRAATQPTLPAARAASPGRIPAGAQRRGIFGGGGGMGWLDYDRAMVMDTRLLAERRLTATSLAVRLFVLDHGRGPETLDELVPRYLPAVPADPFRADGKPIGYAVFKTHAGADRPVVYHVNEDARDDTQPALAATTNPASLLFPGPIYGWHRDPKSVRRDAPDQWRDLTRFAPPPPPPGTVDLDGDGEPETLDDDADGVPDAVEQNDDVDDDGVDDGF